MRSAKAERNSETLGAADGDVRSHFARWLQESERENIRRDDQERAGVVGSFGEGFVIEDGAVGRGILDESAKNRVVEFELREIAGDNLDAERFRAGLNNLDRLRVAIVRDEESVSAGGNGVTERHRFGGGGGFIEERRVRDVERRQVLDHGLEIQERFQPALGDLGLIRRVGGVPTGVLENVPLNHRWRNRVGIAGADERARDDIFLREAAKFGERVPFRSRVGQIQGSIEANIFRNGRVDQRVEIVEADLREHGRARLAVGADVPPGKGIDAVRFPCRSGARFASRFSVFRGRVRVGCGHAESYGVLLPVQAKRLLEALKFRRWLETNRLARPGMGNGSALSHLEARGFKHAGPIHRCSSKRSFRRIPGSPLDRDPGLLRQ